MRAAPHVRGDRRHGRGPGARAQGRRRGRGRRRGAPSGRPAAFEAPPRSRSSSSPTPRSRPSGSRRRRPARRASTRRAATYPLRASARAGTLRAREGFTRVVTDAATDRVVGVHAVGPHVSELAAGGALAIELMASPEDIAGTIHPHPTLSEGLHEAAELLLGRPVHISLSQLLLETATSNVGPTPCRRGKTDVHRTPGRKVLRKAREVHGTPRRAPRRTRRRQRPDRRSLLPLGAAVRRRAASPARAAETAALDRRCTSCSAVAASSCSNHAWCSRLTRPASSMSPAAMASTIG